MTVFAFNHDEAIRLSVDEDKYGSEDLLAIKVTGDDEKPAEATLYDFQYRAIS
ncbi:MAG TPA: hypothetical protein VFC19_05630 [Candidatus Limnocylindrales bacterium]|nr:hypothetical protein [Candidatus Limnocylindrales bacterium]